VVLDEPAMLPDGIAVAVQVVEVELQGRGSAAAIVGALQPWQGRPAELDQLLGEIQEMRDQDVLPARDDVG